MNIEDIRLFTEVVVHQGISEAARRNHMSQQTLSRRIIGLEREVGHALFERTTPISLTPVGRVVLRHAHELLGVLCEMQAEVARVAQGSEALVKVRRYQTDSFFHLLSRIVEVLRQTHPNIVFEFVSQNQDDVDLVRSGAVDVGFVRWIAGLSEDSAESSSAMASEDGLTFVPLRSNAFTLVFGVPEGHPLLHMPAPTLADVASFRIAVPSFASKGAMPVAVERLFKRKGLPMRIDMVYSQTMLEYYAGADPRSVCLFNERYSVESLQSQRKHYVAVRPAEDTYIVGAAAVYRAENPNEALSAVLGELASADEALAREVLC